MIEKLLNININIDHNTDAPPSDSLKNASVETIVLYRTPPKAPNNPAGYDGKITHTYYI